MPPKYPRSRVLVVKATKPRRITKAVIGANPIERYTTPLPGKAVVNPNNVKTAAQIQLDDTKAEDSVAQRLQPQVDSVTIQLPINPHTTVSVGETTSGQYPTPWANLDDELRRQQLLAANTKVRQLNDATQLGDTELRLTLSRLLPGESIPDDVLTSLGSQFSPESKLLISLLTRLSRTHTKAAEAAPVYHPAPREAAVERATVELKDEVQRKHDDPRAQAKADLRQAAQAESVNATDRLVNEVGSMTRVVRNRGMPRSPPVSVSELSDQLDNLTLADPPEPPGGSTAAPAGGGSGASKPAVRRGGGVAGVVDPAEQLAKWEAMREKQPALFRLTVRSQSKTGPLLNYLSGMGIPVTSLGRAGRFSVEHLKKSVLDWHDQLQLSGEGVDVERGDLPRPVVKKVYQKRKARKAQPVEKDEDSGEVDPDTLRWELISGEIQSGNNSKVLVKEAREIAQRALRKGTLSQAEYDRLDARLKQSA